MRDRLAVGLRDCQLAIRHQRVDPGVVDDVGQLRPRQAEVERDEYRSQPRRSEEREQEGWMVEAQEGDPVTVVHAP